MINSSVLGAAMLGSLGMVLLPAPCAAIHAQFSVAAQVETMPSGTWIADGNYTVAPMSAVRFCMDNAEECRPKGKPGLIALDHDALRDLRDVNGIVNRRIRPDVAGAGHLKWSISTRYGDCNDYAVQKRHELLRRGWPSSALSLAVVFAPSGGHLILSVRTDHGDLVLDNLNQDILPWNQTGYHFLKRQSLTQPNYWVEFGGRTQTPRIEVASLRAPKAADVETPPDTAPPVVAETASPVVDDKANTFVVAEAANMQGFNAAAPAREPEPRPIVTGEGQQSQSEDLRIEAAY